MNNNFLGLKILVSVMGAMIIIGTAIVAYTIFKRLGEPSRGSEFASHINVSSPKSFGEIPVRLPNEAVVAEMIAEGARLMLRIRTPDGRQSIAVFNLNTGERLGMLHLMTR
jgi:hypothetical protein